METILAVSQSALPQEPCAQSCDKKSPASAMSDLVNPAITDKPTYINNNNNK